MSELLHAGLESAEVIDLGPEHQVGQLSVRQEDDEEHDGEAHQVLGAAGHGAGKLTHGLVQVDELKKLRGREQLEVWGQVWRRGGAKRRRLDTLIQAKKTMMAATLLNWTCRSARDSKLGWVVWFSSSPLRRTPTIAVLVMFMMIATTLS